MPLAKFISDEEADALEQQEAASKPRPAGFISDEQADLLEPVQRAHKSMLESGISGAADMLTFGHSDELAAALRAGGAATFQGEPFGQAYDYALNDQRRHKAEAEEDNPGSYFTGSIAGAVAPGFASAGTVLGPVGRGLAAGYKALSPVAGGGFWGNVGRGAAAGALMGSGQSNARPTDSYDKAEEYAGDVVSGGALGGATSALFSGLGAMGRTIKDKLRPTNVGAVMLGLPTEAAELYVKNPAAVNNAKSTPQITEKMLESIDKLRDEVITGSKESRAILEGEGKTLPADRIADIAENKIRAIVRRAEGIIDDDDATTINWLKNIRDKYRTAAPDPDFVQALASTGARSEEESEKMLRSEAERQLSTNRVKDFIQKARKQVDYTNGTGQISKIDDVIKRALIHAVDSELKATSPAYVDQMEKVAADAGLLDEVKGLAGSPQAMENLLKRVQRDRAFFPAQKIGELDARLKTSFLRDLKLSAAKDALARGAAGPGGSQKVNLYSQIGRDIGQRTKIPFLGTLGAVAGATVDKRGPAIGKEILDASIAAKKLLQNPETAKALGTFMPILKRAAVRGPAVWAATNAMLMKDPAYRRIVAPSRAEEGP